MAAADDYGYLNIRRNAHSIYYVPSYDHKGGMGDRRAFITATSTVSYDQGGPTEFVDGVMTGNTAYFGSQNIADKYILFQFQLPVLITEVTWHTNYAGTTYYWHFQGSQDNSSWTTLVDNIQITHAGNAQVIPVINTTEYLYYRWLGVSGNTAPSPRHYDMWFKIAGLD